MSLASYQHVYHPPTDAGLPTILVLHGTGGDENDLLPLARHIAPGCGLLSPRGNVMERGMPRFFRRFAEGVFDLEDVQFRAAELAAFVGSAATEYGFAAQNVYALGYSNGANIANAVLLTQPRALRGGMLLRSQLTYVPEVLPSLAGKAVLLSAATHDQLISVAESTRLYDTLQSAGAQVSITWQEASHSLIKSDIEMAASWWNALIA
jgi:phospholipase/carboxylesterase